MWDTNKIPRQGICTIYDGPLAPLEYQKVPLLGLLLMWAWNLGQVSRHGEHPRSRWEFSQKNGEQERMTWGNQSFQKLIPFLYFLGLLIYLLLYLGMNTESRGGQQSWPLSKSGASHKKVLGILHHLLAMRPADILWSFLSDNQKNLFFPRVFFLKPGTTLQIKLHSYRMRV